MMTAGKATDRNTITWVPDYRMPPRHPYPAALDDCLAVYRRALGEHPPTKIIISGTPRAATLPQRSCCGPRTRACRCLRRSCC
jgi:monoterpene epsilon-lactone hydrolase